MTTREQIFQALFSTVSGAYAWATASRNVRLWDDSSMQKPLPQPAFFQLELDETTTRKQQGGPGTRVFDVDLLVYVQRSDMNTPGAAMLNPLLDAIETALAPLPDPGVQTLGGLVYHCWIEGRTVKLVGDTTGTKQCVAIIPVKIMVPSLTAT